MIVVADTSPLNYLVRIGCSDLLPQLYERIHIPQAVVDELLHARTPDMVRKWILNPPKWLDIHSVRDVDLSIAHIGRGEREGILLAKQLGADLILIDDFTARLAAEERGIVVTGTLGVLRDAARRGFIHLNEALDRLQTTTFHATPELLARVLEEDRRRRGGS